MKPPKLGDRVLTIPTHWARPNEFGTIVKLLHGGWYEVLFDEVGEIGLDGGHMLNLDAKSFSVVDEKGT